jgi:4'-phosphopantetheinyl transferase EntD
LFPLPVVAAELESSRIDAPLTLQRCQLELLTAREWDSIRHCAERRIVDFCRGRLCAHRALAAYGVGDFDLLPAADRQPLWPSGLIGSISHTEGFAAAVVAEQRSVAGLGIDVERADAVHRELWPQICAATELERLQSLPMEQQLLAGALTFVAKEAFFKCQYPLAGERFGFDEVQLLHACGWQPDGEFCLQVRRRSRLDPLLPPQAQRRIAGRYLRRDPYLIGAVALAPRSPPPAIALI